MSFAALYRRLGGRSPAGTSCHCSCHCWGPYGPRDVRTKHRPGCPLWARQFEGDEADLLALETAAEALILATMSEELVGEVPHRRRELQRLITQLREERE